MSLITNKINTIPDLDSLKGCTDEQIKDAEKSLGMKFPQEYIDYVKAYGCISFGSYEWTGLNVKGRLNTVEATQQEMRDNPNFPDKCFVLENTGIDAKYIVVDEDGKVYLLQGAKRLLLCNSIADYLDMCLKE